MPEAEKYNLQFYFKDYDSIPYSNTRYIVSFEDGTKARGETDDEGYTENFNSDNAQIIDVRLLHQSIDMIEGGVNE